MGENDIHSTVEPEMMATVVSYNDEGLSYTSQGSERERLISRNNVIAVHERSKHYILFAAAEDESDSNTLGKTPVSFASLQASNVPEAVATDFPSPSSLLNGRDHVDVFISTKSGTGLAENVFKQLVQPAFTWYGLRPDKDYAVHLTTSETSVSELTQQIVLPRANEGKKQTIVLLSGDGGMVDVVNTLIAGPWTKDFRRPEIALLPFGTGNALANSSGITGDNLFGLRTLLHGHPRPVPVFRASFSPGGRLLTDEGREERELSGAIDGFPVAHGAVVCSWGLHATLVADSDTTEYRKFGAERFKMAGKEALYPSDGSLPHAYKGKVSVLRPGTTEWRALDREEHGYVLATLVNQLEAGFHISPSSKPLDGKLRLVHFGRLNGEDAMGVMTKAYQGGQHVHDEKVGYEEVEGVRIESAEEDGRWRRVCVDGKIIRVEKGGWVEVRMGVESVADLLVR